VLPPPTMQVVILGMSSGEGVDEGFSLLLLVLEIIVMGYNDCAMVVRFGSVSFCAL